MANLDRNMTGIGALADPVRRELYRFVASQAAPVSRDDAAAATGIARHQAKFHLDRLEADGLLVSDYARLTGRSGPGAGRPSKRYRRSPSEIAVSLPPREYELAGRLMADAIAESARTGTPAIQALDRLARDYGRELGEAATAERPPTDTAAALELATDVLTEHGYEPRDDGGGDVYLANCPFHGLAQSQTELACTMNLALISGVADALMPYCPRARLAPDPSRCCVVLTAGGCPAPG
ncbi:MULTISPECIES: helix-turn-helix transcriptional regulator [Mycobacteriaceae]|uniref:Transcriptional regulator n=4 Tax=Mycobacteriaceae TaxID=1762 RepID=F5YVI0_MYCSD|nr:MULTISPECIES: helix-turn-helix domain-containing protein [Mycobacteriaceae]AEF36402.1 transcriptional regulator [Mycolicibacter sinensis]OQZ97661.1 transcriptional regulator [Mycolicibacter algericus DSM 45454]BBX14568.1 transcriptional regulator [Mycobacterium novum]GFG85413.1 transcriptional regulator [Mycolicibacter algericus]